MTALPEVADTCPSCGGVHGQPTDWPTCPTHGHLLHDLTVTGNGFTYACPAHKCAHTHTQKEKATMTSTHDAARAALAIKDGQGYWDDKQLAALQQLGIKDVTRADLQVFMHYCQRTGLDPFSRQIYMISRNTKDGPKQTIQVGIDGYRIIAQRAARRDGVTLSYGPTYWYDGNGDRFDVWVANTPPAAASVTVYRDGKPFPGIARFAAFAAVTKDGQLMGLWATMGDHLIAKCAEAQALRKAFPHDLAGIQTDDEAAHIGNRMPRVTMRQATQAPWAEPEQPAAARAPDNPPQLEAAITAQFDRLGVEDTERRYWVLKLAGLPDDYDPSISIPARQYKRALAQLESCADTQALRDLTDRGDKPGG